MINYNFYDILDNANFINQNYFSSLIISDHRGNKLIDEIWNKLEISCRNLPIPLDHMAKVLKNDVLISVYTTILYTVISPITLNNLYSTIKEKDPVSINENSFENEKRNMQEKRRELFSSYHKPTLSSGQFFDNNALQYLSGYWERGNEGFKSFNHWDFCHYLKSCTKWPFYPDNTDGMMFHDYLEGIRDMFQHNLTDVNRREQKQLEFDDIFSAYLFEELFHPSSFIQNVSEFLSVFESIFTNTKEPKREQAIFLLQPLFKMPSSLWKEIKTEYFSAVKRYIDNSKKVEANFKFKAALGEVLFYQNFLFPYLKAVFSMAIYNALDSDLNQIKITLFDYISSHLSDFDYFNPLKEQLNHLSEIIYPETGGKNSKKINDDNDTKRNNKTIDSFEINFTYNFFGTPHTLEYFENFRLYGNTDPTVEGYLHNLTRKYLFEFNSVKPGTSASNYLRLKSKGSYIFFPMKD